ncbi:MAG: radical SAM protein, partial [Nitrosomonadales bacterium]|nr:radical SAM protein [Nitrosomonadales bacterium]
MIDKISEEAINPQVDTLPTLTPEMLKRFDVSGPRYTSYPTADRFVEAFGEDEFMHAIEQRRMGGLAFPLSIYVHIPFCESLCFYCACNKIVTKHHERAAEYLDYLTREVDLYISKLGKGQTITQLHLGGGTPTFFNDDELDALMAMLRRNFTLAPSGEYSIEVDPRTVDKARLKRLADMGFNRLSFGVQDFDHEVQKAVHRI